MYSKYAVLKDNQFFSCKHCECYRPRHPSVKLLEKNRMHTICVHCVNVFCFFVFPFHSFLTSLHSGITQVDRTFRPDMLFAIRITPVIEVGNIQRLYVTFRYFSQQCGQSASFCKESFYVYVWESNTSVALRQIPHPINDFQLYRRFANITRQSDQETILTVRLHVTSKHIVLGIRDQGGCRTLFPLRFLIRFVLKRHF